MARVDLDEYELGERIGVGTAGTIFEARKKATGQVFAIKLISPAVSQNQIVVSRFAREMMILEKLSHPNILEYFGGGEQDGQLFFVMELIRGGTLKELLRQSGPLSWQETVEVSRQVAAALQHAHNHGIIHRDLKPGNVFITEDGQLKLGDFGIARDTTEQDLTDAGLTVGTYSYMAPELVRGEREITGQVDLYALGCLMFELLTGRTPYLGDNFAQIFDQHLHATPPTPSSLGVPCPAPLETLISQLLAKKPEDRPFNARSVQGFLGELLESRSPADAPQPEDRAARDITPAQEMLTRRLAGTVENRQQVSWRQLVTIGVVIVVAIVAGILFSRMG